MNQEMFVVVNHPCYTNEGDAGLRIYKVDDSYLQEHPSMFSHIGPQGSPMVFGSLEEAEYLLSMESEFNAWKKQRMMGE